MSNTEILEQIERDKGKSKGVFSSWLLLGISLFAFTAAGIIHWDFKYVVLIAVVIFIHELGHLLAMKLYRYKNLKMLFLPFIGGAASGESNEANAYKIAMISLSGPIVGFLSCIPAAILYRVMDEPVFLAYAKLALLINAFNLLPILPLDGGQCLNETLFSRFPKVELIFKILGIGILAFLAYRMHAWILGIIAFFIFLSLGYSYKTALAAKRLRKEPGMREGALTTEKVKRIRQELKTVHPSVESSRNPATLPRLVSDLWTRINKIYPSTAATVFLLVGYLAVCVVLPGFTAGFIQGIASTDHTQPTASATSTE